MDPLRCIPLTRWDGFVVVDTQDRVVCYPSRIPKLYVTHEQARNSLNDDHRLVPCTITQEGIAIASRSAPPLRHTQTPTTSSVPKRMGNRHKYGPAFALNVGECLDFPGDDHAARNRIAQATFQLNRKAKDEGLPHRYVRSQYDGGFRIWRAA